MLPPGIQDTVNTLFLQPAGLLALSALIPLIIFYLVRKKPEEQIMPSMMFFFQDKKSGKAYMALKTLLRNLMLIFHVLLIAGFAAALAHPFLEAPSHTEETVVVFDKSASMSNNMEDAREFVGNNLGQQNTLITVGNSVDIPVESASGRQVMNQLENTESEDVKSDIASALEAASDYEGTVVVASDLDQSISQKSSAEVIENMRNNDRTVKVMHTSEENSWGIVNVEPGKENSSVDVKNFQEKNAKITVSKGSSEKRIDVEAGSVSTVTFPMNTGENTIKLQDDGFEPDNKAYISVPEDEEYDIAFISEGNPYFEKAVELIDFVNIETYEPPVSEDLEADIYVVGRTNRILADTVESIEDNVNNDGSSLVVFSHPGVFDLGFESLPVEKDGAMENTTATVKEPRRIDLGRAPILGANKIAGTSYSNPEHALVEAGYGNGNVFFYNLNQEFRHNFFYPVLWKHIFKELTDRPSVQELNVQTGEEIEADSIETPDGETAEGSTEARQTGFYQTGSATYAANLESEDESYAENPGIDRTVSETGFEERDVQNLAALLLALLIAVELGYLKHLGEI